MQLPSQGSQTASRPLDSTRAFGPSGYGQETLPCGLCVKSRCTCVLHRTDRFCRRMWALLGLGNSGSYTGKPALFTSTLNRALACGPQVACMPLVRVRGCQAMVQRDCSCVKTDGMGFRTATTRVRVVIGYERITGIREPLLSARSGGPMGFGAPEGRPAARWERRAVSSAPGAARRAGSSPRPVPGQRGTRAWPGCYGAQ